MKKTKIKWLDNAISLFEQLEWDLPTIETRYYVSSLDESVITEKTIDGTELKSVYKLKCSENNKNFKYEHTILEEDKIEDIRNKAWSQLEAWKYEIKQEKLTLNGNKERE